MCIIGIKPHGIEDFKDETLKYCWEKNDDGAGFAWFNGKTNKWAVRKGFMKFEDFLAAYRAMKFGKQHTSIVHFRIGTSGYKDAGNTHPFPICDDLDQMRVTEFESEGIAFHNGTVGKGDTKYSDTEHHIANFLFPIYPLWDDKRVNGEIADTLLTKNTSRWVVCIKDQYWTYGTWHKHKGLEFSNLNYEPISTYGSWNSTTNPHYNSYNGESKWWSQDRDASKNSDLYKEAQKLGVPNGIIWAHGKLNGELGYWSGGKFTPWKKYIEEKKKEQKVIELPQVKNYSYKIDDQSEFDTMFIDMVTNKDGKTDVCMNWKKLAVHIYCIRRTSEAKNNTEPEKEDHTQKETSGFFVKAIVDDNGDLVCDDKEIEDEQQDNLKDYMMCPACFEGAFLKPTPFVDQGTHMCTNCGCVFTLETGEIFMYEPEIQQKYMKRRS